MARWVTFVCLVAAQNAAAPQPAEPVTKIIETLQNVLGNLQEEHRSDEQTYKKFYDWCQAVFTERKSEHQRYETGQAETQSKLQVQQAQNKQLKDEAQQLEEELKSTKEAIEQASQMRAQEHQDYLKEESNFAQVLQALNRAVDVLSSSTSKQTLLQVTNSLQQLASQSSVVNDQQRDQLQQFAQRAASTVDDDDVITQSSTVTQVLHELIGNFQQSAAGAVEQEKSALDQYDSLIALKKQSFQQVVSAKDSKDALLAESLQRTAQVQRSLEDLNSSVKGMEDYLHGLQGVCAHKSSQWASRSQSRADILEGLQRSLASLQGDSQALQSLGLGRLQQGQMPQQQQQAPMSFMQPAPLSFVQVAQQSNMLAVQADLNTAHKGNTYSAVKGMVDSMIGQMQSASTDEDKHKQWCDAEISKSAAAQEEKSARLQRLATKIDNERELVNGLDADLSSEAKDAQSLQNALQNLAKVRMDERDLHNKAAQNHQMAQQILTQATAILQRVNALAQQAQAPSTYGFLQASGASQMQAVSSAAVESLSSLQTRYATLISACDKAENQANIDLEDFGRASQALQETLARTHNYKTSVRLQGMSGLDQDTEDEAALKTQLQSVTEYVSRLRTSCAGILQHYDERRQRREQSLQVLQQAKNVINVDNAEEIHSQLKSMAANTDQLAASLVSTSSHLAPAPAAPAPQPASLGMLSDSLGSLAMSYAPVGGVAPAAPAPAAPQNLALAQQGMALPQQGLWASPAAPAAPAPPAAAPAVPAQTVLLQMAAQTAPQQMAAPAPAAPAAPADSVGAASILKDLEGLAQLQTAPGANLGMLHA